MTVSISDSHLWGTDAWIDVWTGFRHPLQEPGTLPERVQNIFAYNLSVSFPLVTEISELAEQRPYEISEMTRLLSQGLRESAQIKLKVLTLLNELIYNEYVVYCVRENRPLMNMIKQCQTFQGTTSTPPDVAGNIRMFCCEIEQKIRMERGKAPPKTKPKHIQAVSFPKTAQKAPTAKGFSGPNGPTQGGGGFQPDGQGLQPNNMGSIPQSNIPEASCIGGIQQPPTPGMQQPPTPGMQQPPTPGMQQPPTPGMQQPPTPGMQKPPTPGMQQVPAPGMQQPPTPGMQQPPTPGMQQPPTPGMQKPPTPGMQKPPTPGMQPQNQFGGMPPKPNGVMHQSAQPPKGMQATQSHGSTSTPSMDLRNPDSPKTIHAHPNPTPPQGEGNPFGGGLTPPGMPPAHQITPSGMPQSHQTAAFGQGNSPSCGNSMQSSPFGGQSQQQSNSPFGGQNQQRGSPYAAQNQQQGSPFAVQNQLQNQQQSQPSNQQQNHSLVNASPAISQGSMGSRKTPSKISTHIDEFGNILPTPAGSPQHTQNPQNSTNLMGNPMGNMSNGAQNLRNPASFLQNPTTNGDFPGGGDLNSPRFQTKKGDENATTPPGIDLSAFEPTNSSASINAAKGSALEDMW